MRFPVLLVYNWFPQSPLLRSPPVVSCRWDCLQPSDMPPPRAGSPPRRRGSTGHTHAAPVALIVCTMSTLLQCFELEVGSAAPRSKPPTLFQRPDILARKGPPMRRATQEGGDSEQGGTGDAELHRQQPKKRRSRRRQIMLNMRRDKRPQNAKPKGLPPELQSFGTGYGRHGAPQAGSQLQTGENGKSGGTESAARGAQRMPGEPRSSETADGERTTAKGTKRGGSATDRALSTAAKGETEQHGFRSYDESQQILHTRTGREWEEEGGDGNDEGNEDDSGSAYRPKMRTYAAKFRRMRKRWGDTLELDDAVAQPLADALEEQEDMKQDRMEAVRSQGENSFEWATLGISLGVQNANRTVVKVDTRSIMAMDGSNRAAGEFALWGRAGGLSSLHAIAVPGTRLRWGVKIDKLGVRGGLWMGLLLEPFAPALCQADQLDTCAWMLNDVGVIVRTGRAGREELNGRASFRLPAADLLQVHERSMVIMTHERLPNGLSQLLLQIFQPGIKYAGSGGGEGTQATECRLQGIPCSARPFVNLVHKGDQVSLIGDADVNAALKRLRQAPRLDDKRLAEKARRRERQEQRTQERERLKAAITNDDERVFNPLGKTAGQMGPVGQVGAAAEAVDKDLHRDSLFDDSSAYSHVSAASASASASLLDEVGALHSSTESMVGSGRKRDRAMSGRGRDTRHNEPHANDLLTTILTQPSVVAGDDEASISSLNSLSSLVEWHDAEGGSVKAQAAGDAHGQRSDGKREKTEKGAEAAVEAGDTLQRTAGPALGRHTGAGRRGPVVVKVNLDEIGKDVVSINFKKKSKNRNSGEDTVRHQA